MAINLFNFKSCVGSSCVNVVLPDTSPANCDCVTVSGRINDLFWLECDLDPTDAELIDPSYWQTQATAGKLRRMGSKGIGGMQKKNVVTQDIGGCGTEVISEITWQITWRQFCFDQSALALTHEFASKLLKGAVRNYNLFVRPCSNTESLLPIGNVSIVDFDNNLPENTVDKAFMSYEFNYKALVPIIPFNVPGLNAVVKPN